MDGAAKAHQPALSAYTTVRYHEIGACFAIGVAS
jgi:hypothetical protein